MHKNFRSPSTISFCPYCSDALLYCFKRKALLRFEWKETVVKALDSCFEKKLISVFQDLLPFSSHDSLLFCNNLPFSCSFPFSVPFPPLFLSIPPLLILSSLSLPFFALLPYSLPVCVCARITCARVCVRAGMYALFSVSSADSHQSLCTFVLDSGSGEGQGDIGRIQDTRARSLSFDDLYALAPAQVNSLASGSIYATLPLNRHTYDRVAA